MKMYMKIRKKHCFLLLFLFMLLLLLWGNTINVCTVQPPPLPHSNEVVWLVWASSCVHTEPPRVFTWIYHGNLRSSIFICKAVFIEDSISVVQPDDAGRPADSTAPVQTQTVFLDVHFISQCSHEVSLYTPSIWNSSEQTLLPVSYCKGGRL